MSREMEQRDAAGLEERLSVAQESIEELRALHELKGMCTLLNEENDRHREQIIAVSAELEGINVSITETEEYIAAYNEKRAISIDNIDTLSVQRNRLTEDLNHLQLKIKAAENDVETCLLMQEALLEEFTSIRNEKDILIKRLKEVEKGIMEICQEKSYQLPRAREQDEIYNKIYKVFKEAENRMEVSVQFRSK